MFCKSNCAVYSLKTTANYITRAMGSIKRIRVSLRKIVCIWNLLKQPILIRNIRQNNATDSKHVSFNLYLGFNNKLQLIKVISKVDRSVYHCIDSIVHYWGFITTHYWNAINSNNVHLLCVCSTGFFLYFFTLVYFEQIKSWDKIFYVGFSMKIFILRSPEPNNLF